MVSASSCENTKKKKLYRILACKTAVAYQTPELVKKVSKLPRSLHLINLNVIAGAIRSHPSDKQINKQKKDAYETVRLRRVSVGKVFSFSATLSWDDEHLYPTFSAATLYCQTSP
ncbi:hypothetical protein JTB14_009065 [Gonioctena quinquepunctata]|nr:hypothetical protein JTB14_009065 [Gonioctena quinquepunctata]